MLLRSWNIQKWRIIHHPSFSPCRDPHFTASQERLRELNVSVREPQIEMKRYGASPSETSFLMLFVCLRPTEEFTSDFRWFIYFVCTATPPLPLDAFQSCESACSMSILRPHVLSFSRRWWHLATPVGRCWSETWLKKAPTFSRHPGHWKKSLPWWYQILETKCSTPWFYSLFTHIAWMLRMAKIPAALQPGQLRTWEKLSKKLHPSWCWSSWPSIRPYPDCIVLCKT